jgi:hypothetical protein
VRKASTAESTAETEGSSNERHEALRVDDFCNSRVTEILHPQRVRGGFGWKTVWRQNNPCRAVEVVDAEQDSVCGLSLPGGRAALPRRCDAPVRRPRALASRALLGGSGVAQRLWGSGAWAANSGLL